MDIIKDSNGSSIRGTLIDALQAMKRNKSERAFPLALVHLHGLKFSLIFSLNGPVFVAFTRYRLKAQKPENRCN